VPVAEPTGFELLVTVMLPDRKVQSGCKTKVEKQEPLKFGPVNVAFEIGWDVLLLKIMELLEISVDCLVISSMEWHFLKPQNSPWLPMNNENTMQFMLRQAAVKFKKDASSYMVLQMQQPLSSKTPQLVSHIMLQQQNRPIITTMQPWTESTSTIGFARLAPDNNEPSDDDTPTSSHNSKKTQLDDDLQGLASELESLYLISSASGMER